LGTKVPVVVWVSVNVAVWVEVAVCVEVAITVTVPLTVGVDVSGLEGLEGLELLPHPAIKATGITAIKIKKLTIFFTGTSPFSSFSENHIVHGNLKRGKARNVPPAQNHRIRES